MSILEFILKGVVHMINNEILTTNYILQIRQKINMIKNWVLKDNTGELFGLSLF